VSTTKPDVEATRLPKVDLRPSRIDIRGAFACGNSLSATKREAVIEAFAQHALLYGGEHRPDRAANLSGRISRANINDALAVFDDYTRTIVPSILEQAGGLA
jgi:hypothetical protein